MHAEYAASTFFTATMPVNLGILIAVDAKQRGSDEAKLRPDHERGTISVS